MRFLKIIAATALAVATLTACELDLDGNSPPPATVVPPPLGDWAVTAVDLDTGTVTCARGDETTRFTIDVFTASFYKVGGLCLH